MKNMKSSVLLTLIVVILICISGCGDEDNTLPWGDQLDLYPGTFDLSDESMPAYVLITFAPYDDKGNPYSEGNCVIYINEDANGLLSLEGEDPGLSIAPEYGSDGVANVWYVPTNREELVTVYAYADQYPHSNVQSAQIRIVNQVLSSRFTASSSGLVASFINGACRNDPDPNTVGDETPLAGLTFLWSFGDGNTSTLTNPQHTYAAAGTYSVTLAVTEGADTVASSLSIEVSASK